MLKKFKHVITNSNIVFGYLQITIRQIKRKLSYNQFIWTDRQTDRQTIFVIHRYFNHFSEII
jgi:hypothetical protein